MIRSRAIERVLLALLAVLFALPTPAWAIREWYEHYLDGKSQAQAGRCTEALRNLQEAVKLKPGSAVNEQTYGLQFVDYFPYYWMGVCYLKAQEDVRALEMFQKEEDGKAIKKHALHEELLRRRAEAKDLQNARITREVRQEFQRQMREADELYRKGSFQDALTKLAEAVPLAKNLGPEALRAVADLQNRIRATEEEIQKAAMKAQRIDQLLAEGGRRLEEGRNEEAQVAFDQVLELDPRNARAADGKQTALERIRASRTRQEQAEAYQRGKALVEAGQHEDALVWLTQGAADPRNLEAQDLLKKTHAVVEGIRKQKEKQEEIDRLFAQAEKLFTAGQFPEAVVAFESVLRLDKEHVQARKRLDQAERQTGEAIFKRWLPDREPVLYLFSGPDRPEVDRPTLAVRGIASDDYGVARVEIRLGGKTVTELLPLPRLDSGEPRRTLTIERELPLAPGLNDVVVTVTDTAGVSQTETFRVTRRLRFYETRLFVPSAGAAAVALLGTGLVVQRVRRRRALRRRFNPYIAGAPVLEDEMFFGREKLTQRLLNVLHHNSLMITGERRIGKTTFLYHLKKVLAADEGSDYRFFPVFVDLQGVPEQAFFHALMSEVVETLQLSTATLHSLRFTPEPDHYDGRDFSHDLQRVIEELKGRTPGKVKLALLIDEVDVLNEYSERVNQRLRGIFMKTFSENLVAVMSGVGVKRTWNSEVSPWYNFFDEIEIAGFSRDEAEALIKTPVAGVFRYQAEAVERILELSRLKPYLVQKFCVHAVNRMLEDGRTTVRASDVEAAADAAMFEGRPHAVEPEGSPTQVSA